MDAGDGAGTGGAGVGRRHGWGGDLRVESTASQRAGLRETILRAIHAPTQEQRDRAAQRLVGYMAAAAGVDLTAEIDNAHRRRAKDRAS